MKPKLIVIGDLHLKAIQPFLNGLLKLLQYLNEKYSDIPILFLGDIFDTSAPHWEKTVDPFQDFLLERKAITYIVSGNHDRSDQKGNALKSVSKLSNVKVFFDIEDFTVDNLDLKAIPYLHGSNKEKYNELSGKCDYTFSHIYPEKYRFGNDGFDIPVEAINVHGHIHEQDEYETDNIYRVVLPGIPQITREGEQHIKPRIMLIQDKDQYTFEDLPVYCTIETIEYGEEPESKDNLINIINAPSVISVYQRYPSSEGYYIREEGVEILLVSKEDEQELDLGEMDDIIEFSKKYADEEGIDDALKTLCINKLIECRKLKAEAHG